MQEKNKCEMDLLREEARKYGITTSKTRATRSFLTSALKRVYLFLQYKQEKLEEKESFVTLVEENKISSCLLQEILLYRELNAKEYALSNARIDELKKKGIFFNEKRLN